MADNIEPTTHLEKVIVGQESPITHLEQVIAQYGGSRTDELVKMDSTTDAKYLSELIDKNTVVKINGKDAKVEISVNQDGQWSLNFLTQETTIKGNSTIPAASEGSPALDGERLAHQGEAKIQE